ncbi:MAG: hypothetical protein DYG94_07715 [Leptolyngbya sp. PLA3]|nr:MAG: hypothetical protein EDM82_10380 [Cyanobacteria bacterium CYA]MCE7968617.1 hypothetical protein [Leptolyngbya sp. PL-A3]
MRAWTIALALAGTAVSLANAADTFLVVRGDDLYRYDGNTVQTFTLTDTFHSLSLTEHGIIGVSNLQENVGNPPPDFEVWRLDGALSPAPFLTRIDTVTDKRFPTLTQVGSTLYGIGEGEIYTVAPDFSLTFVTNVNPGEAIGGSGYDAASDTFYVSGQTSDALFTLDLGSGNLSQIGTGVGFDFRNQGGEWWRGEYWAAFEDLTNDRLVLGTIDTTTGLFSIEVVLQNGLGTLGAGQTMGLAIIPTPASLALLGLGGLAAARRRR